MILDYVCLFYYKACLRKKVRHPWDDIERAMRIPIIVTFAPLLKLGIVLFQGCGTLNFKNILFVIFVFSCVGLVYVKVEKYHRRKVEELLEKYNDRLPNMPLFLCVLLLDIYVVLILIITEIISRYVYIPLGLEGALAF